MKASFIQTVIDKFPEATIIISCPIEMDIRTFQGYGMNRTKLIIKTKNVNK